LKKTLKNTVNRGFWSNWRPGYNPRFAKASALCPPGREEGRNEAGPYQSPMEDGMQHFHEFYRRIVGNNLR
jgi:hypothetical protein